jgi:hypothetical protein
MNQAVKHVASAALECLDRRGREDAALFLDIAMAWMEPFPAEWGDLWGAKCHLDCAAGLATLDDEHPAIELEVERARAVLDAVACG